MLAQATAASTAVRIRSRRADLLEGIASEPEIKLLKYILLVINELQI
jgi:hypothetical protein